MRRKRKLYLALGIVQVFIAIGAIPAGIMFLIEPNGSLMGMDASILKNSPFSDFTIPALFLLIVLGIGNSFGALLSFQIVDAAGKIGIILGAILILWIIVQVYWMGYTSFLQPVMLGFGIVEIVLGYSILSNLRKIK